MNSLSSKFARAASRGVEAAKARWRVERIGPLEDATVQLPRSSTEYLITRPTDVDALLDMAERDPEENLPYWSALWPSGIALADAILADPSMVAGRRVLELGSGLGVTAIAAISAGAELTATDYSTESLELTHYNVEANGQPAPTTMQVNWRSPSPEFREMVGSGFPVVLAADVLYEQRDVEPLLELIDWLVAPEGMFWLAEPRRNAASRFIELVAERGWGGPVDSYEGPWPELNDTGVIVRIHELRRTAPAG